MFHNSCLSRVRHWSFPYPNEASLSSSVGGETSDPRSPVNITREVDPGLRRQLWLIRLSDDRGVSQGLYERQDARFNMRNTSY